MVETSFSQVKCSLSHSGLSSELSCEVAYEDFTTR